MEKARNYVRAEVIKPRSLKTQISASIMIGLVGTLLILGTAQVTAMFTGPTERELKLIEIGEMRGEIASWEIMTKKDKERISELKSEVVELEGKIAWRETEEPKRLEEIAKIESEVFTTAGETK